MITGITRTFSTHINGCIFVKTNVENFLSYLKSTYHYLHYYSPIVRSMLLPYIIPIETRYWVIHFYKLRLPTRFPLLNTTFIPFPCFLHNLKLIIVPVSYRVHPIHFNQFHTILISYLHTHCIPRLSFLILPLIIHHHLLSTLWLYQSE